MEQDTIPGCCALKEIFELECIGGTEPWEIEQAKDFDTILKEPIYNSSASILTLSSGGGLANLRRQQAFVKKRGFKLLGQWKARGSRRWIYLYGSKEFKMPRRTK